MRALAVALVGVSFALVLGATGAAAPRAITPDQALADLNAVRAQAGLAPVEALLPKWNEGCRLHNVYESHVGDLTHEESKSSPWWTQAGADAGASSVLAEPEALPWGAWGDSIYHRNDILQPRLRFSGFSASNGFTCMRTIGDDTTSATDPSRSKPSVTVYPWPPANATGVPLEFGGGESPDPYDLAPPGTKQLGYLLSLMVNGPWGDASVSMAASSASLTGDDGRTIPLTVDDGNGPNADYFDSSLGLYPDKALASGTTYRAHAAGTISAYDGDTTKTYPYDYSWSFTTVRVQPSLRITGSGQVVKVVGQSDGAIVLTARKTSGGTLTRRLAKPGSVTLPLTRGRWKICGSQAATAHWLAAKACATRSVS
jgi:hypothetical protein